MADPAKWASRLGVSPRFAATATGVGWLLAATTAWAADQEGGTSPLGALVFAALATLFAALWWSGATNPASRRLGTAALGISIVLLVLRAVSVVAAAA